MHKEEVHTRKRGQPLPLLFFRFIITVVLLMVFGLGVYQAFRYFSGIDPVKTDPKAALVALISSDQASNLFYSLFGVNVPDNPISRKLTAYLNSDQSNSSDTGQDVQSAETGPTSKNRILRFAVVADSHTDSQDLAKALFQAKDQGVKFVIGVGDYTNVGTLDELEGAKKVFDASGLKYYLVPGDHDLWDGRDKGVGPLQRYNQVFGNSYSSFADSNIRFILVDNSDNYYGIDGVQMNWLNNELTRVKDTNPKLILVFLHEPLYHPSSDHFMGDVTPALTGQAKDLIQLFNDNGVGGVISGDTHFFAKYTEPDTGLKMYTIGAITNERNAQAPRYALIDIFDDGSYNVQDLEIK